MHPYSDDELFTNDAKALKIAEHIQCIDGEEVSKVFKKIKRKGIFKQPIEMHVGKNKVINVTQMKIRDYIDQFIYYRKLRGYTQEQVGQVIGISGKTYSKYEKRIYKFKEKEKIETIANFLGINEELKMLPINDKIDKEELKKLLIENDITNTEFSNQIGVSRRSIVDWFNKDVEISEDSWRKIKKFMAKFKETREDEEEME